MSGCRYTDFVLASFLDGDGGPFEVREQGWVRACTSDELASHQRGCADCERALAAARRLDALVATTAETRVDAARAEHWLDAVEQRVGARDGGGTPRSRSRVARVVGALVLIAVGFALAKLWPESDVPRRPESRVDRPAWSAETIVLPRAGVARPIRPPRAAIELTATDLETAMLVSARARAAALGIRRSAAGLARDARAAARAVRLEWLRRAADGGDRRDVEAIVERLRTWPEESLDEALAIVRGAPRVLERLAASVHDGERAWIEAAALAGGAAADQRLARRCAADPLRTGWIAAALARPLDRPGRARLLVRLWDGLRVRGLADDALAVRWFAPQPPQCTAELLALLGASRNAEERRLLLVALAACADSAASEALVAVVEGVRHDEAVTAAFALGCVPAGADDLARSTLRRDYLRRCALVSRRDPSVREFVEELRLTQEERAFLSAGAFNEEQFRIAAALCRERRTDHPWADD